VEVPVVFDQLRPEAPLEDVALVPVPPAVPLSVAAVQVLHSIRDGRLDGRDEQVEVIRHQAPGVQLPVVALERLVEEPEEPLARLVVREDGQLANAAADEVVDPSCDLGS
jgi:hypothetical protein